jgi:hypothetical protein
MTFGRSTTSLSEVAHQAKKLKEFRKSTADLMQSFSTKLIEGVETYY